MYCDVVDAKRLKLIPLFGLRNLSLLVDLSIRLLQLRKHISTLILSTQIQHLPKDCAGAIKMRRRCKCNKELTSVYSRASRILRAWCCPVLDRARSHGKNAAHIVPQSGKVNLLVHRRRVVYGRAAFGDLERQHRFGSGGGLRCWAEGDVSALDHEPGNEAVEGCVIVCAACAEGEEVLGGLGNCFAE